MKITSGVKFFAVSSSNGCILTSSSYKKGLINPASVGVNGEFT